MEEASDTSIEVHVLTSGAARVLRVSGEIDMYTAPMLDDRLAAELSRQGGPVLVDLSGVTFLSSSGVGALLANLCAADPDRLVLVVRRKSVVERVLGIMGVSSFFSIHASIEAAVAESCRQTPEE